MSITSELTKTASYLRSARKAILGRGGEISLTAGLKDLPDAIFNIPADASLAYHTDEDIAYRKTVPVGAEEYALLSSIGGMTYLDEETQTLRDSKVTEIVSEGVNKFNIDCEPTRMVWQILTKTSEKSFKVTMDRNVPQTGSYTGVHFHIKELKSLNAIYLKCTANPIGKITKPRVSIIVVNKGGTQKDYAKVGVGTLSISISDFSTKHPDVDYIDLIFYTTAGEPCDAGDGVEYSDVMLTFDTPIPAEYVPYKEPISYPIPEEIQVGKGIDGYADTIDFEREKYIQKCLTFVLDGTEDWGRADALNQSVNGKRFSVPLPKTAAYVGSNIVTPSICNLYNAITVSQAYNLLKGVAITSAFMYIWDSKYALEDISVWKAHLAELYANGNPLTVTYALAEPIETDISEHLKDFDKIIEVEGGGSLEFVNEYETAVPSTVKYTIKTGG